MIVYKLDSDIERYPCLFLADNSDTDRVLSRLQETRSLLGEWPGVAVTTVPDDRRPPVTPQDLDQMTDSPYMGPCGIVLSHRASSVLHEPIQLHGEVLPVKDAPFGILHVMNEIDAFDIDGAKVEHYKSSGDIMLIKQYAFKRYMIGNSEMFRIPTRYKYSVFVTQAFVSRVEAAGLKGFEFQPVWSDEYDVGYAYPYRQPSAAREASVPSLGIKESPLTEAELRSIEARADQGAEIIRPKAGGRAALSDTPRQIHEQVSNLRRKHHKMGRIVLHDRAAQLGCLWGQCVCAAQGWEWIRMTADKVSAFAIASPDRAFSIAPINFMLRQITSDSDPTDLLLYNMINDGNLPPRHPGILLPLG